MFGFVFLGDVLFLNVVLLGIFFLDYFSLLEGICSIVIILEGVRLISEVISPNLYSLLLSSLGLTYLELCFSRRFSLLGCHSVSSSPDTLDNDIDGGGVARWEFP